MTNNYNYLFQYLEKEGITFDKSNFLYQIQSHPEYPTLIAVTDTLNFFNIPNGVIRVEQEDIDLLPNRFISFQNHIHHDTLPFFVEKVDDFYTLIHDLNNAQEITKTDLLAGWTRTVLLIERNDAKEKTTLYKRKYPFLLSFCIILFFINLYQYQTNFSANFLILFPLLGTLLSIAALKDVFGIKNNIIERLCLGNGSDSCNQVMKSKKWKLFELINFGDLSLIFFFSQISGFILFVVNKNLESFLNIQKSLLFLSVPFLALSIYYQKYIERRWCKICLLIIATLSLEFFGMLYLRWDKFSFSGQDAVLFALVFSVTASIWQKLKKILAENIRFKNLEVRANRFIRNYETFKRFLKISTKTDFKNLINGSILLGNPEASLRIIVVFSPFCKHCSKTFKIITDILQEYDRKLCIDMRFDVSEGDDLQSQKIHNKLVEIYLECGEKEFINALNKWFESKDQNVLELFKTENLDPKTVASILEEQFQMNRENGIRYTPTIIINRFVFPKEYQKEELLYFINDLLHDENF